VTEFLKNLRNSCEKKMERSEESENPTTQEGNIQAVPISRQRPVPSSSAASNATITVPVPDKHTSK
jgi:hypothetical protein